MNEIEKVKANLEELKQRREAAVEKCAKRVGRSTPHFKDVPCPKCKAKKGNHCKAPSGNIATMGHKERHNKVRKKLDEFYIAHNELQCTLRPIDDQISSLRNKLWNLEDKQKKAEKAKEFLSEVKPAGDQCELVVEKDREYLIVVKVRNLSGIIPGDQLPSPIVTETMMKWGVDVTIVAKEEAPRDAFFPGRSPVFAGPFGFRSW